MQTEQFVLIFYRNMCVPNIYIRIYVHILYTYINIFVQQLMGKGYEFEKRERDEY